MIEYCCYAGNENIVCEETYCDECDFCPDAWFNLDDEDESEE